ncbi:hypothetical protein CUJ83_11630 [Methanocella sp. CWC-04]|uniref:AB hydrolase-1 domain-containing protein n=1 Tax=Methanooceanicella nereidis TaxID=2052831 RepID=A0AAP2W6S7_9EURY|nr:alpha/beta hydrolase [Methanocella sp. CWC-04]MCD1295648.1 hypothetical protein [Methanocella sp. CWC-04]
MEETVLVDGINVYYEVEGKGEDLLLIHGMGMSGEIWKETIKAASRFFRVIALDLPGFGSSDKPDAKYGIPYYVEYIKKFMDALEIEEAYVAGVSFGGYVAASFASKYPENVIKLVLTSPMGLTPMPAGVKGVPFSDGVLNVTYWLLSKNKNLFKSFGQDSFYDKSFITDKMIDEQWSMMKDPRYRKALQKNARYLSRLHPEYVDTLKAIVSPTLIIWGKEDRIMPVSDAQRYRGYIQGSRLVMLDRCGHMAPIEKKEDYNKALLTFLGEVDIYYQEEA